MAEEIILAKNLNKEDRYLAIFPQIEALISGETDLIANIANLMAVLKYNFNFLWVGVYFVKNNELVLGPFQGTIACTRITKGKGVCGTSLQERETLIISNVNEFKGHIACSSDAQSEIVIPVFNNKKEVALILDVDSNQLNFFDKVDEKYLTKIIHLIRPLL